MLFAETDFWTSLFSNLPNTLLALGTLLGIIFSHWRLSSKGDERDKKLVEVAADVRTIEKATNSMKDALVKATGDARYLEGQAEERRNPESPAATTLPTNASVIRKDIAAIPEKTAAKVVEKLKDETPQSHPQT